MKEIWQGIYEFFDIPPNVGDEWFVRIKLHMGEVKETRAYNNWDFMMEKKKEHLLQLSPIVVLAAFFQYYHYDGNRNVFKDNCEVFKDFCNDAQFEDTQSKMLILKLIGDRTIKDHFPDYEKFAGQLQDLDLSILASREEDYETYTQLLRREYHHLDDETYDTMRIKVLKTLLRIPNIFLSPEFQPLDAAARRNMEKEIQTLKK